MATYSAITSGQIDAESPLDVTLAGQWTNNLLAVIENAAGSPAILGLDPIVEVVVSSPVATVDFQDGVSGVVFDSTYDEYLIRGVNVVPATDGVDLRGRVYVGGSLITTSSYRYTSTTQAYLTISSPTITIGSDVGEGMDFWANVFNPASTTQYKRVAATTVWNTTAGDTYSGGAIGSDYHVAANAIDGFRLYFSSGNIESGTFRLYGVRT